MSARQNPLSKFEELMERIIENPFGVLFPSKIEPAELSRKLQRSMDKGLLIQGGNHRLAPNVYDIYLSVADHQNLEPSSVSLIKEWQKALIDYAIAHHYTLRITPILRLHTDSSLRLGFAHIDAKVEDPKNINAGGGSGGVEATQALSAEQLAILRAQLMPGQDLPGIPASSPNLARPSMGGQGPSSFMPPMAPPQPPSPPLPQAMLIIRLPQGGQQNYRIEKPVINIGRQLSNDIIVEDKRVSRNHAQIKYQFNGQFALYDLGSTNGVTIHSNGVNITIKANSSGHMHQHLLRTGDRFTIGSYEFYFERR